MRDLKRGQKILINLSECSVRACVFSRTHACWNVQRIAKPIFYEIA